MAIEDNKKIRHENWKKDALAGSVLLGMAAVVVGAVTWADNKYDEGRFNHLVFEQAQHLVRDGWRKIDEQLHGGDDTASLEIPSAYANPYLGRTALVTVVLANSDLER